MGQPIRRRFFDVEQGRYRVRNEVRRLVRFHYANLVLDPLQQDPPVGEPSQGIASRFPLQQVVHLGRLQGGRELRPHGRHQGEVALGECVE